MAASPFPARSLARWSVATFVCLVVFAGSWWVWEALRLPPAGGDRLAVALAVAGAVLALSAPPLAAWASREKPADRPKAYLTLLTDRGPAAIRPITPGESLNGMERTDCPIVVPEEFDVTGRRHARLYEDE